MQKAAADCKAIAHLMVYKKLADACYQTGIEQLCTWESSRSRSHYLLGDAGMMVACGFQRSDSSRKTGRLCVRDLGRHLSC